MSKKLKKLISVMLAVLMITVSVSAAFAAEGGFKGSGTEEDPYLIESADDLSAISKGTANGEKYTGVYFRLSADIDLGNDFIPVGTKETPFEGIFDGSDAVITGGYCSADDAAVFAYINNAVITGVTVSGYAIEGEYLTAAIAANAVDSEIKSCKAEDVMLYGYSGPVGGIAAKADNCVITDCTSSAEINAYEDYAGGIAGLSSSEIRNCVNTGAVSGYKFVGGIAGQNTGTVLSCKNTGAVSVDGSVAGGIAGSIEGTLACCSNTGAVSASSNNCGNLGGIAGNVKNASLYECSNSGAVSAKDNFCGGVAAYVYKSTVKDCFNSGKITSTGDYAAGIYGYLGTTKTTKVSYCYNAGTVNGADDSAAGIGGLTIGGEVANCLTSAESLPLVVSNTQATIKDSKTVAASELKDEAAFEGWDFENTWEINGYHSYHYPVLKNIEYHDLSFLRTIEPTCTKTGHSEYFCSICMAAFDYDETEALGHDFVVDTEVKATCTKDGYGDFKCSRCDATKTEEYKATGHIDANNDLRCDICNQFTRDTNPEKGKNIFQKIADFFTSIFEWIKNLFRK